MVLFVPTAMPFKKQAARGWQSGMFQKKNDFTGWEVGQVTSKVPSNTKLLQHQIAGQGKPSSKRGLNWIYNVFYPEQSEPKHFKLELSTKNVFANQTEFKINFSWANDKLSLKR